MDAVGVGRVPVEPGVLTVSRETIREVGPAASPAGGIGSGISWWRRREAGRVATRRVFGAPLLGSVRRAAPPSRCLGARLCACRRGRGFDAPLCESRRSLSPRDLSPPLRPPVVVWRRDDRHSSRESPGEQDWGRAECMVPCHRCRVPRRWHGTHSPTVIPCSSPVMGPRRSSGV